MVLPDWRRLRKALSVEADGGFTDMQGNQYRFSEFLCLSLGKPLEMGNPDQQRRWQSLAEEFAQYSQNSLEQRQRTIAETRRLLHTLEKGEQAPARKSQESSRQTTPVTSLATSNRKISLDTPTTQLEGITKRKASLLERLGLYKVRDILFYYPRDHMDYARQVDISALEPGETVTVLGTVKSCNCFTSPKNRKLSIFSLEIKDSTGQMKLSRFMAGARFANRGWQEMQKRQYPRGSVVAASGLVKKSKYGVTLDNPEIEVVEHPGVKIESVKIGRVLPVYPLTEGVPADWVRSAVMAAMPAVSKLEDPLPKAIVSQYGLMGLQSAIANIHFPENTDKLMQARRRLVFDEFFYLQLGFLSRRQQQKATQNSAVLMPTGELIEQFKGILPFSLTNAQNRVVNDILTNLDSTTPMNRIVQGDVGSGKTVVAVFAILAAIQSGYQAALMSPTEVLAEQHYRKMVEWFNQLFLRVELLTGSTRTAKRREIHSQLETGELPLLIGTHALIQDPVKFKQLGLVVIDEQHRFGVHQRAKLLDKGQSPHTLTMTATPIPRTLALTLHGDMDVSQIDELPPGRQAITTTVLPGKERPQAYQLIRREIAQGRQAYIVFPMIEESEKLDVRAAVEEYQRLQESIFPDFQVGLLHGRMSSEEKDTALNAFRDNETQIIVSTTVIEVGVDVPNATVMMIENAERFGLSQLHQLRGRVGRGSEQSFCLLMSNSKTDTAKQRLGVLEQSQDGFFISEMDMRFRGPGEVLGTKQSGLPDFALASLVEDQEVLNLAREAAEKIILAEGSLQGMPSLRQELELRYQKMMDGAILT